MHIFNFLCALLIGYNWRYAEACTNTSAVRDLTAALLAEYERDERPRVKVKLNSTELDAPATVGLSLFLRHGMIDEDAATAVVLADLLMVWTDPRLAWNTSNWSIETAYVSADAVWHPDTGLLNTAEPTVSDEPARIIINSKGKAYWMPRLKLTVPCNLQLEDWPNDLHYCGFEFGSRFYPISELDYYVAVDAKDELNITSTTTEVGEWTTELIMSQKFQVQREGDQFGVIRWAASLRRRGGALLVTARVVTVAAALLIGAALLAAPTERLPMYAAAAMVTIAQLMMCAGRLPPAGQTPRLLRLQAALLSTAGAAAVCAALVSFLASLRTRPYRPLRQHMARVAFLSARKIEKTSEDSTNGAEEERTSDSAVWEGFAIFLDILLSSTICLVVVILLACFL